jgi:hypothetical protein
MIDQHILDDVLTFTNQEGGEADVIAKLRSRWPDLHFTHCMEDELGLEKPIREGEYANIYGVDGREHCLKITPDFESATGLLIAELSS